VTILPEMLAIVPRRLRNHWALQSQHIFVVLVVVPNGVGCPHSIEAKMLVAPWFYAIAPLEKASLWQILLYNVNYKLGFLGYRPIQHVLSAEQRQPRIPQQFLGGLFIIVSKSHTHLFNGSGFDESSTFNVVAISEKTCLPPSATGIF
jgi:hypothetical protein